MKTECFEVVSDVVQKVSASLPDLSIDSERYEILQEYCDAIDILAEEFDAAVLEAGVNTGDLTIFIRIKCEDIIVEFGSRRYFDLAERAVSFRFYTPDEDVLINEFTFPSVWIKRQ